MFTLKLYRSFGLPSPKQEVEFGLQILAGKPGKTKWLHIPIAHSCTILLMSIT